MGKLVIFETEGIVPNGSYRGYGMGNTAKTKEDIIAIAEQKHDGEAYWLIHSNMLLVKEA